MNTVAPSSSRSWYSPADGCGLAESGVEEGDKRGGAEGAAGVKVGVVGRPARHDLLIIDQRVAVATQRAARHPHLGHTSSTTLTTWTIFEKNGGPGW